MPHNNPATLLEPVIDLSKEAADKILEIYNSGFDINRKDDSTPVTTADLAAHMCIVEGLKKLTPALPILSEESTNIPFSERKTWETYWLVDPLDGTREFIKRNGEFTVNIALIHNHEVILGVVYIPISGVCYFASKNSGAFKIEGDKREQIHVTKNATNKIRVASSRSHAKNSLDHFLQEIGDHELVFMGSSIKSCLVAEGTVDVYPRLGPTSEWDTAAAQCVVEEAGGYLTDTQMNKLCYNTKESLLNPEFFVFGNNSVDWSKFL